MSQGYQDNPNDGKHREEFNDQFDDSRTAKLREIFEKVQTLTTKLELCQKRNDMMTATSEREVLDKVSSSESMGENLIKCHQMKVFKNEEVISGGKNWHNKDDFEGFANIYRESYPNSKITPNCEKISCLKKQLQDNYILWAQKSSNKETFNSFQFNSSCKKSFQQVNGFGGNSPRIGGGGRGGSEAFDNFNENERDESYTMESDRLKYLEKRCGLLEMELTHEKAKNQNKEMAQYLMNQRESTLMKKIEELETSLERQNNEIKDSKRIEQLETMIDNLQRQKDERDSCFSLEENHKIKNDLHSFHEKCLGDFSLSEPKLPAQMNQNFLETNEDSRNENRGGDGGGGGGVGNHHGKKVHSILREYHCSKSILVKHLEMAYKALGEAKITMNSLLGKVLTQEKLILAKNELILSYESAMVNIKEKLKVKDDILKKRKESLLGKHNELNLWRKNFASLEKKFLEELENKNPTKETCSKLLKYFEWGNELKKLKKNVLEPGSNNLNLQLDRQDSDYNNENNTETLKENDDKNNLKASSSNFLKKYLNQMPPNIDKSNVRRELLNGSMNFLKRDAKLLSLLKSSKKYKLRSKSHRNNAFHQVLQELLKSSTELNKRLDQYSVQPSTSTFNKKGKISSKNLASNYNNKNKKELKKAPLILSSFQKMENVDSIYSAVAKEMCTLLGKLKNGPLNQLKGLQPNDKTVKKSNRPILNLKSFEKSFDHSYIEMISAPDELNLSEECNSSLQNIQERKSNSSKCQLIESNKSLASSSRIKKQPFSLYPTSNHLNNFSNSSSNRNQESSSIFPKKSSMKLLSMKDTDLNNLCPCHYHAEKWENISKNDLAHGYHQNAERSLKENSPTNCLSKMSVTSGDVKKKSNNNIFIVNNKEYRYPNKLCKSSPDLNNLQLRGQLRDKRKLLSRGSKSPNQEITLFNHDSPSSESFEKNASIESSSSSCRSKKPSKISLKQTKSSTVNKSSRTSTNKENVNSCKSSKKSDKKPKTNDLIKSNSKVLKSTSKTSQSKKTNEFNMRKPPKKHISLPLDITQSTLNVLKVASKMSTRKPSTYYESRSQNKLKLPKSFTFLYNRSHTLDGKKSQEKKPSCSDMNRASGRIFKLEPEKENVYNNLDKPCAKEGLTSFQRNKLLLNSKIKSIHQQNRKPIEHPAIRIKPKERVKFFQINKQKADKKRLNCFRCNHFSNLIMAN